MGEHEGIKRRTFLAGAAVGTGLSILPAHTVFGAPANEKLKLGLIGCGNRGVWLSRLFEKHANTKVTALHDYFKEQVDAAGEQFDVPPARRFIGLDGYKELLATGVDAVAIESPPYFHPAQAKAAIEAGKHVFLAKPLAVDVPGCNTVLEAGAAAKGTRSFLVDFQTRADPLFREAAKRVHERMIGAPVLGHFFYHCGRLNLKEKPGTEVARLRNWCFDIALSGDIIVEQNIHVLDVATWYLDAHPLKAHGCGGRKARTDAGDCWDHFVVAYTFPDEVRVDFSGAQFVYGFNDLCMRLHCETGTVESHYGGPVHIKAKAGGWRGGETPQIYQQGAVNNMIAFEKSIRTGDYINNVEDAVRSTRTSILGRKAAYDNRAVTWEEMLADDKPLDPKLDLPKDGPMATRVPPQR
ncbi:MAG: Gfo/Idh/MocA family protein [Candidatus Hydrogenedentota bacterium]